MAYSKDYKYALGLCSQLHIVRITITTINHKHLWSGLLLAFFEFNRLKCWLILTILHYLKGCEEDIGEPICAARMFWGTSTASDTRPTAGVSYFPAAGVDSNQLHWQSLKPFDDADIYITGDTFSAWSEDGAFSGFSEGALLASERILVNQFGLTPIVEEVCLQNPWPKEETVRHV